MRLTKTPWPRIGYEPTWMPFGFNRVWREVRYGAINDSGRLLMGDEMGYEM
jgi:hypothetical protein